ncbi:MAG: hypothetical protein ACR2QG_03895 [Gammaproteobacteria bacterium]
MMRTGQQPLAHLVDAAAVRWLTVDEGTEEERAELHSEITDTFKLGDRTELTYHGLKYLLTLSQSDSGLRISVHEIATGE